MNRTSVVVKGVVKDDGTLEVAEKVHLPAGPVQVTVQPTPQPTLPVDDFLARMDKIRADLQASGHVPRTKEEIDTELRELRDEAEEEIEEAIRLHRECEKEQPRGSSKDGTP